MRLRLETVKNLRALGAKKRAAKEKAKADQITVTDPSRPVEPPANPDSNITANKPGIATCKARVKKIALAKPPVPKVKFRKRQVHKSWLPTHMFHAKRAHMTPPSAPLWRFAVPLTPTQKGYRSTHRATHERGAVAWDMSYMSTIGLEGEQRSIEGLLKALGVGTKGGDGNMWRAPGEKWRQGRRVWNTFAFEREAPHALIAPVSVVWCASSPKDQTKRKLFLRVHPSSFYQLWEEVGRLSKVAKPSILVEDLRFEIGSIEIAGPGSTEALLGALWPIDQTDRGTESGFESIENVWRALAGVTNPAALPSDALLAFDVHDPRLHHPPRTVQLPKTPEQHTQLLELLSKWPPDQQAIPAQVFDRKARMKGSKLASQKAINRRKSNAKPGEYPVTLPADPHIPVLLYTNTIRSTDHKKQSQASWTLLAPWKCIQPIWYSIMYYPLSTGQQPRFGGLREQQQTAFENESPWFPADYPGTEAGWESEIIERRRRWEEWQKRPKGKRVSWEKVDLGNGNKGELGEGWSCDWALLLAEFSMGGMDAVAEKANGTELDDAVGDATSPDTKKEPPKAPPRPEVMRQVTSQEAALFMRPTPNVPASLGGVSGLLFSVCINLIDRGVPQTCARIYRLPSSETNLQLRKSWTDLLSGRQKQRNSNRSKSKHSLTKFSKGADSHIAQKRLAQSLLQPPRAGEDAYPACPGVEDLIGFVTTGNFNLAEGRGVGIGSLLLSKVFEEVRQGGDDGRLCIVRNAGADVGRLARWRVV